MNTSLTRTIDIRPSLAAREAREMRNLLLLLFLYMQVAREKEIRCLVQKYLKVLYKRDYIVDKVQQIILK